MATTFVGRGSGASAGAVGGGDGDPLGPRADPRSAWAALRSLCRAVRANVPLHRRLLWPIDPRPLRRRR